MLTGISGPNGSAGEKPLL